MKKIILTILIAFCCFGLWAQGSFPSENGLFTVNYLKGCEFTEIEVTLNAATGTPFLCFDADLSDLASNNDCFGNPAQTADDFRFTYQEAGIYNILFLRQLSNTQVYDSITIEIIEPSTPYVSLSNCGAELILDLDAQQERFDFYTVDFGDGSAPQEYSINAFPFSYQYADPTQEYLLTVTGSLNNTGNNNCGSNIFTKTFIPEDQNEDAGAINRIEILSENSFEIDYELNDNQIYQLQLKQNENGNYQTVNTFSGEELGTYIFQNRNLDNNFYCARIITVSQCNGDELISNEVCTIRFSAKAELDGNLMDWNHFIFQNSELLKNGEVIHTGNAPFLDENVLCGQSDLYQVIATDARGIEIVSLPKEITAITGSPSIPISQIATNVLSDSELELTWELPQGLQPERFVIYKKRNLNDEFFEVDTSSNTTYVDQGTAFYDRIFYYSIAYVNSCGGISPLYTTAPNILLKVSQKESVINFVWNSFTGFDSLFSEYRIVKYDENMNVLDENILGEDEFYNENIAQSDDQLAFYQVEAYSDNGLIAYSNLLRYKIPSSFFVPTAFTPNQNSLNEEIKVVGKFIEEVEFSVYNRWGTLIFRSNSLEIGWDGYLKNRPAPEGTYSYIVRVKDKYGEEYFKSGVFNLIR
ncbi:gliding motility-associated C-terminal domain-containing protein [Marivirga sp.]|uniref:T9SS type B sorting domain-containing protein n=1 Tax=Marivirga sp. TaxID=2018662 RepID=UPI0025E7C2E2|nr:gliding motility-associated C-terminal domain-containing protein [Marivirga sp.]